MLLLSLQVTVAWAALCGAVSTDNQYVRTHEQLHRISRSDDVDNFDATMRGYEYIYHDQTDLLLVIKEDQCYFMSLPDGKESEVSGIHSQVSLETRLSSAIEDYQRHGTHDSHHFYHLWYDHHHSHPGLTIVPSTLDVARDTFADRLADFHCLDKRIFLIHDSHH